jgi:hypothetical protein
MKTGQIPVFIFATLLHLENILLFLNKNGLSGCLRAEFGLSSSGLGDSCDFN